MKETIKKWFAVLTGAPQNGFQQPDKKLLAEQHQLEAQHHEEVAHEQEERREGQEEQRFEREASEPEKAE